MAPNVGLRLLPRSDLRPSFVGSELLAASGSPTANLSVLNTAPLGSQMTGQQGFAIVAGATGTTHEPVGMTPYFARSGGALIQPTEPGLGYAATVQFKDATTYTPPVTSLGVTLAAPGPPPSGATQLGVITYPLPFTSGSGHGYIGCPNLAALNARSVYMRSWVRLSENWYGEGSGVLKLFQPRQQATPTTGVTNRIIVAPYGARNNALSARVAYQTGTWAGGVLDGVPIGGTGTTYKAPIGGTGVIVRGQWHLWEIFVQLNTAGVADGTFQMWVDGALTHNYVANNQWDPAAGKIDNAEENSVYGGPTVANSIPDNQYITYGSPYYVSWSA